MRYRIPAVTLAVAGLAGCSLFGGSTDAVADLRNFVTAEVADEERAGRMLAEIDVLESAIERHNAMSAAADVELRALNRDYDATRAQFEVMLKRQNEARWAARDVLVASALSLRDLAMPDEWSEMAELEIRAYRERLTLLPKPNQEEGR